MDDIAGIRILRHLLTRLAAREQTSKARVKRFKVVAPLIQFFTCHHRSPLTTMFRNYDRRERFAQVRL